MKFVANKKPESPLVPILDNDLNQEEKRKQIHYGFTDENPRISRKFGFRDSSNGAGRKKKNQVELFTNKFNLQALEKNEVLHGLFILLPQPFFEIDFFLAT